MRNAGSKRKGRMSSVAGAPRCRPPRTPQTVKVNDRQNTRKKNRYKIKVTSNKNRNRYIITAYCDFDSNGNGKDDRFTATTDINRGEVRKNREVVQTR